VRISVVKRDDSSQRVGKRGERGAEDERVRPSSFLLVLFQSRFYCSLERYSCDLSMYSFSSQPMEIAGIFAPSLLSLFCTFESAIGPSPPTLSLSEVSLPPPSPLPFLVLPVPSRRWEMDNPPLPPLTAIIPADLLLRNTLNLPIENLQLDLSPQDSPTVVASRSSSLTSRV